MKLYTLILSFFLSISPLLGSDYLTIEQQNEEMDRAFRALPRARKTQEVSNNQSSEFLSQIFPTTEKSKNPSSVMTLTDWEQTKKHAAETIFHRLNDALSFLLTNREIIFSALLKNPELIRLTCYTVGQDEQDHLCFDFPLLSVPHPVAHFAQGCLILKEYQYWIDVLFLFKNIAFSQHTLSSYDHNAACAIKDLIQSQISILDKKINAHTTNSANLSQFIDQIANHDVSFFVTAGHSFPDLLKGHLQSIDDVLPRRTVTQINLRTAPLKKKEGIIDLGKNKRDSTLEKISPKIDILHSYFSGNYTAILTGIRSTAIMQYVTANFTQEDVNMAMKSPFYAAANNEYERLRHLDYEALFKGLKNNMISVQKIRRELGLPKEIFKGLDFSKEMQKALNNYQFKEKEILMKLLQTQEIKTEIVLGMQTTTSSTKDKQEISIEPNDDQKTNQESQKISMLTIQEPGLFLNVASETVEKNMEEENYIFDSTYFKVTHEYYQNKKNQTTMGSHFIQKLTEYETNLYSYLLDNIFRPQQRPTWNNLISGLSDVGFKGKANTSGNGSTWEFSVTEKNVLFFGDLEYKGATFNVHKFKGNDPIHPRYLMYFQSGFSNVFGLTEAYLIKKLTL